MFYVAEGMTFVVSVRWKSSRFILHNHDYTTTIGMPDYPIKMYCFCLWICISAAILRVGSQKYLPCIST